jgi:hypothetical protein
MHVDFSIPFTLLANYIKPGGDLSSAVRNKGRERGGIKTRESFELPNPSHRAEAEVGLGVNYKIPWLMADFGESKMDGVLGNSL